MSKRGGGGLHGSSGTFYNRWRRRKKGRGRIENFGICFEFGHFVDKTVFGIVGGTHGDKGVNFAFPFPTFNGSRRYSHQTSGLIQG